MTLVGYRNPYRHPPNCPIHPLHSEPCPFCTRREEALKQWFMKEQNEVEVKSEGGENPEAESILVRDASASRIGNDAGELGIQGTQVQHTPKTD